MKMIVYIISISISESGNYIEIFVNTNLNVCEKRDVKGLYKLFEKVLLKILLVFDPFETPNLSEIVIDGSQDL